MTTLATSSTGAVPTSGFQLGTPPIYYDLKTTATFSGAVSVCLNYAGTSFRNQTDLHLFHYQGGTWVDVTTSVDTVHTTICGSASSFSPFVVAQALYAAQVQQPRSLVQASTMAPPLVRILVFQNREVFTPGWA